MDNKIFINQISDDIWANKTFDKFYYKFEQSQTIQEGLLDYSNKKFNKSLAIAVAKAAVFKLRNKSSQLATKELFSFNSFVAKSYDDKVLENLIKLKYYQSHAKPIIGNLSVHEIKLFHFREIFSKLVQKDKRYSSFKILYDFLYETFNMLLIQKQIKFNPLAAGDLGYDLDKQYLTFLKDKISEAYNVVNLVFKENPLVLSFFLFILNGKKKEEILKLQWELIDFEFDAYRIDRRKPKRHFLHPAVKEQLLKVRKTNGLVYQNEIDMDQPMVTIDEQSFKINQYIPDFSLEVFEDMLEDYHERQSFVQQSQNFSQPQNNIQISNKAAKPKIIKAKRNFGKSDKKS